MNKRLEAAVAAATKLDDETQERLATVIEAELQWDEIVQTPESRNWLAAQEKRVLEQIKTGKVYDTIQENQ